MMTGKREDRAMVDYVDRIYPREDKRKKIWEMKRQQRKLWIVLGVVTMLVAGYCFFSEPESSLLQKNEIKRQQEDTSLTVEITAQKGEEKWQKDMTFAIKQKKYTEEEMKMLEEKTEKYLSENLPGENPSLLEIRNPLVMNSQVPDTEIQLEWLYDEEYIREDGTLIAAAIPDKGVDTEVRAEAVCRNWKKSFTYTLHLLPVTQTKEQEIRSQIKGAIKDALKNQQTAEVVTLPEQVGDMQLQYEEKEEKSYGAVFLMLILWGCVPFLLRERQKKKLAEREEQMLADHPGIVNKIMLLLGAGLTIRKSVERLTLEYERERQRGGILHYAYEELCIMNQEMKDGISEGQAMEHFGKRCRLLPYLRFASVITQNLKKGAEGILDILEKESMETLEQRKDRVLQMGEKAGTKLLFPMMLMLGLVMGIIMIPAFMTM
ncbi:MAG: type II secretion system F family protein [Eubacterium sp.]|nr:type II secretion system F family protein [Eubacterium sp.]